MACIYEPCCTIFAACRHYEEVYSCSGSDARKRVCQLDGDLACSDDDDDDDSLLDSEVSELLQSPASPEAPASDDHSPYKRLRQPDAAAAAVAAALSTGRPLHAPRPSLDLYKMQVHL